MKIRWLTAVLFGICLVWPGLSNAADNGDKPERATQQQRNIKQPEPATRAATPTDKYQKRADDQDQRTEEKGDWWHVWSHKLLYDPVAGVTGVLALFTLGLWGATLALVRSGERMAERHSRAFVTIRPEGVEDPVTDERVSVTIGFRNVGQTPAFEVSTAIELIIVDEEAEVIPVIDAAALPITLFDMAIAPGEEKFFRIESVARLSAREIKNIKSGKFSLLVRGCVHYFDVADEARRTFLSYRHGAPDMEVYYDESGNDME